MSETTNLKLFKHDNPSTNENQFDVNKALNQNWDKLDEFAGEVNDKVIEIEDNIEGQGLDIDELQQKTEQIEENISDIQQGQETQNTEIANLQTEVEELNEDIKANAIIEETEKTKSLYIDDANASRGKVNVFGNMEQDAEATFDNPSPIKCVGSNKNLYKPVATSGTKNGISYSIDEKGIVTLNGTASAQTDIAIINSTLNNQISNVAGKKITFKVFNSDLSLYGYLTGARYVKDTAILTDTETEILSSFIRIPENTECNNLVVYPKIEEGEKTSYSPYNQGSTEIKHTNKNIIDLLAQTLSINGWHMSKSYNENDVKVLQLPYNPNAIWDTFYFSLDERYVGKNISFSFDIKVKNLKYLNPERFCLQNSNEYSKSVIKNMYTSSLKEDTYTRITVEGYNLKNSTIAFFAGIKYNSEDPNTDSMYVYIKNFQIELGEQVTECTEHQEESYQLDIQQDMVSSEDDYFDLERKKEVHGWKKIIFDGVNNRFTNSFASGNNTVFRYNGATWDSPTSVATTDVKSTHFKVDTSWSEGTMYAKYTSNGVAIQAILKTETASNTTTLNNLLKQKYDAGEPVIVYFKDEEPTELDLTDTQIEQLEKLNKLRFYEGVNNIMTTEDIALLQAKYSQNLKVTNTKMQQQIDEIKELLSTTQTSAMLLDNLEKDLIEEVK